MSREWGVGWIRVSHLDGVAKTIIMHNSITHMYTGKNVHVFSANKHTTTQCSSF